MIKVRFVADLLGFSLDWVFCGRRKKKNRIFIAKELKLVVKIWFNINKTG